MPKLLKITYMYNEFLRNLYTKNKTLSNKSYNEQFDFIMNQFFYESDGYQYYFKQLGYKSDEIITNALSLQKQWAIEHNTNKIGLELLVYQIKKYKPTILFIQEPNIFIENPNILVDLKTEIYELKLIIVFKCSQIKEETKKVLNNADIVLTCTKSFVDMFNTMGFKTHLLHHAFDTRILEHIDNLHTKKLNKIIFAGSILNGKGYHSKRKKHLIELLNKKLPLDIYTQHPLEHYQQYCQEPKFGLEYYQLLANYNINFNIHVDSAHSTAGNLRMFETTGVGSLLVTENQSNIDDFFTIDREIIVYDNLYDAIEKLLWLIENPTIANNIAIAGQKRTLMEHTFEQKVYKLHTIIYKYL